MAINVALYGPRHHWAMTERSHAALRRDDTRLSVGPSAMTWDRGGLTIDIDEVSVPFPRRLRGRVRLEPEIMPATCFAIDAAGRHIWQPIAPRARVEAHFTSPRIRWTGSGYFDHNIGAEPLERAFRSWNWSRADADSGTIVVYDPIATGTREAPAPLCIDIRSDGSIEHRPLPPTARLPRTLWRIDRTTRCDAGAQPRSRAVLEDTPFYARSLVETSIAGRRLTAFHESLDLGRFCSPIVQAMLPFRMPRRRR